MKPPRVSPDAERIMALKVGKTCVVSKDPKHIMPRIRARLPGAQFSRRQVESNYVITRTA